MNSIFAALLLASPPTPSPPAPTPTLKGEPGKGFGADFGEDFSFRLRSRLQLRGQVDVPKEGDATQTVGIGSARVFLSGHTLSRKLEYLVHFALAEREFREGARSPLLDAFFDWKAHRDLNLKVGQQFVPFDRLRTVRDLSLQLGERAKPLGEFTLDRDLGAVLYSDRFLGDTSPVAVRLGAFSGAGLNANSPRALGGLLVARVELRPLGPLDDDADGDLERRTEPRLALGLGAARSFNSSRARGTTGATFTQGTFDSTHAAVDAVFKWRGWAVQAEGLWKGVSTERLEGTDADGAPVVEATRAGYGWIAQASYVFDPPIEVVARASRIIATEGTDPKLEAEAEDRGQELGLGLNYYLKGHAAKAQLAWFARTSPSPDLETADQVVLLLLDATF
ncbi:MAG: porin [Bradymonadia bacterium]